MGLIKVATAHRMGDPARPWGPLRSIALGNDLWNSFDRSPPALRLAVLSPGGELAISQDNVVIMHPGRGMSERSPSWPSWAAAVRAKLDVGLRPN